MKNLLYVFLVVAAMAISCTNGNSNGNGNVADADSIYQWENVRKYLMEEPERAPCRPVGCHHQRSRWPHRRAERVQQPQPLQYSFPRKVQDDSLGVSQHCQRKESLNNLQSLGKTVVPKTEKKRFFLIWDIFFRQ